MIIDVREDDYEGGHIPESRNIPFYLLKSGERLSELYLEICSLKKPIKIIFHCMRSQIRGPSAARKFSRLLSPSDPIEVLVLEGGFLEWRNQFASNTDLIRQ